MTPYSGSVPTIPARFATAATSAEFVDFNELLHALESEGTEETPVQIELGEDNKAYPPQENKEKTGLLLYRVGKVLCRLW